MQRLGRLRYELFVERDGKSDEADHASESFIETIGNLSRNLQATDHQRCLAAVRLTRGRDALIDRQLSAILLDRELARPPDNDCLLLSRLTVRRELRARLHIPDLFRHTYSIGSIQGARYASRPTFSTAPSEAEVDDPRIRPLQSDRRSRTTGARCRRP
ncbi:hypothetical protein [Bosea sp. ASV33]|uniref:hypothetical protein n=1 Tax=Bosea sp. ASV33 TaxID=2795106 RepID=UPI0018EE317E|nr:hypothetical protein [Bosea sp. ASV33]